MDPRWIHYELSRAKGKTMVMLLLGIVFMFSIVLVLIVNATLRDILKANGSLLKFYSVILCDTLITIDTVGILNEMKNA